MRKKLVMTILLWVNTAIFAAAIPTVNQYQIEKRETAPEPLPQQLSISVKDQQTVTKPPYSLYTHLVQGSDAGLFRIQPYGDFAQLPKIGKWMIAVEKTKDQGDIYIPAHWLDDLSMKGQYIIEPINYIFVVYDDNKDAAIAKLTDALVKTGFTTRWSGEAYHSDNYHAYIGDQLVSQLKRADGVFLTFSNNNWLKQNDHFRVMGPYQTKINNKTAFLFASSVSEETNWDEKLYAGHYFVSFTHSRDNLAKALIKDGYPTYYVLGDNTLNTPKEFTEDHDDKLLVTVFK